MSDEFDNNLDLRPEGSMLLTADMMANWYRAGLIAQAAQETCKYHVSISTMNDDMATHHGIRIQPITQLVP